VLGILILIITPKNPILQPDFSSSFACRYTGGRLLSPSDYAYNGCYLPDRKYVMSVTTIRLSFAFEPPEQLDLQLWTQPVYVEMLPRKSNEYRTKRNI